MNVKLVALITTAGLLAAAPAYANGNSGGNIGDTTNNTTNDNQNYGGAGGHGGTGVGVGIGQGGAGGSVRDSGNSSSLSGVVGSGNSRNTNTLGQTQAAIAAQGQQQGISDSGNSAVSTHSAQVLDNAITTGAVTTSNGGNSQSNAGNNAQTEVNTNYQRDPVMTAYAAPLTFSQGTCYISASAGGQGVTFGLSAAVPIEDKGCTARATAQALYALGEKEAAVQYLASQNKAVSEALKLVRGRK